MHLTVLGSGDITGTPVHGCHCILCRQARAVRHLRRRPGCLQLENQGERLLINAGIADLGRRLSQDPVDAVVLTSWHPARWQGLIPVHMGKGREIGVFGPEKAEGEPWLLHQPGRLNTRAALRPDQETLIGRFRVLPFAPDMTPGAHHECRLAYGIRDGEERLVYLPAFARHDSKVIEAIRDWQADVVVAACPTSGSPSSRLAQLQRLHEQLAYPALLLIGLEHHMDLWLQSNDISLPDGIRLVADQQRLETRYLTEYARLAMPESGLLS